VVASSVLHGPAGRQLRFAGEGVDLCPTGGAEGLRRGQGGDQTDGTVDAEQNRRTRPAERLVQGDGPEGREAGDHRGQLVGQAGLEGGVAADRLELQDYITRAAWGEIWTRPGLPLQTRHLLTIVMLAALHRQEELEMHLRATSNTGLSPEQVREALMQVAVYAGVPAANSAMKIAKRVLFSGPAEEPEHG